MSDEEKKEPVRTFIFEKFSLFKDTDEGKNPAKLSWAYRAGYPRITVYLNNDSLTTHENFIVAPMKYDVMLGFLDSIKRSLINNTKLDMTLDCNNLKWIDNKRTDEVYVQASIHVLYDIKTGLNISIITKDRPVVVFNVGESIWHKLTDGEDKELKEKQVRIISIGYITAVNDLFAELIVGDSIKEKRSFSH